KVTVVTVQTNYPVTRARDALKGFQCHGRHLSISGGKTLKPIKPRAVLRRVGTQPRTSSFCIRTFCDPTCSPAVSAHAFHDRKSSACAANAFASRWQHSSIQVVIESSANK